MQISYSHIVIISVDRFQIFNSYSPFQVAKQRESLHIHSYFFEEILSPTMYIYYLLIHNAIIGLLANMAYFWILILFPIHYCLGTINIFFLYEVINC